MVVGAEGGGKGWQPLAGYRASFSDGRDTNTVPNTVTPPCRSAATLRPCLGLISPRPLLVLV
jgi:hypothetical protein